MNHDDRTRVQIATAVAARMSDKYDLFKQMWPGDNRGPAGIIAERSLRIATEIVSQMKPKIKKKVTDPDDEARDD